MPKMGIQDIARELEMDAWTLVGILRYIGYRVEGYTASLEEEKVQGLLERIRSLKQMGPDQTGDTLDPDGPEATEQKISFCLRCGKRFGVYRHRHPCVVCSAVCCESCTRAMPEPAHDLCVPVFEYPEGSHVCEVCHKDVIVSADERLRAARKEASRVETWPSSAGITLPIDKSRKVYTFVTGKFEKKREALYSLQATAAYLGCDILFKVKYDKETVPLDNKEGGHHILWQATGSAGHRDRKSQPS